MVMSNKKPDICTWLSSVLGSQLISMKLVRLSGLVSIYPGRELAERSALLALQQQGDGGPIAFWFGCFPSLFRLVWTTSCKKMIIRTD